MPYTHTDATTSPIKYAPRLGSMINDRPRGRGGAYVSSKENTIVGEKNGSAGGRVRNGIVGIVEVIAGGCNYLRGGIAGQG